jgi:hypothetical protein
MEKSVPGRGGNRVMRTLAILAGISNALFWIIFGVVISLWEGGGASRLFVHILAPGLLYAALVLFALRRPRQGGWLLILTGIVVTVGYPVLYGHSPVSLTVLIFIAMALPPLVAGGLFLAFDRSTLRTSSTHGASPETRDA